jgi:Neutral/alkaline non-lysosomal ceramidase, N-terminal
MRLAFLSLSTLVVLWTSPSGLAQTPAAVQLRVGAAKVDVTPDTNPQQVLDRLYSRAIVIANGATSAALVTVDTIAINDGLWQTITERAGRELGIPARNIFITATHTHSGGGMGGGRGPAGPGAAGAPGVAGGRGGSGAAVAPGAAGQAAGRGTAGAIGPGGGRGPAGPNPMTEKIFTSVKMAKDKLQPARMGYGTGLAYLNVNREIIEPKTRLWHEGANYDGVSDKTVAVLKFETLDGDPIAVYYSYALHGVITGTTGMVSGDAPGAASSYIEDSFDDKIVAVWSTAAEGDQNPIFFQQTFDVRDFQTKAILKQGGRDYSDSIPPMTNLDRNDPVVKRLERQQKQMILTMGQMLGEEVLHVMRTTDHTVSSAAISSNQTTVTCPGRQRIDTGVRAGVPGTYVDAADVPIRLSYLRLGDIALAGVNAEIYAAIGMRLKRESPIGTMMVTLTNGSAPSGYIPNDAAYSQQTFEVLGSRVKPGCAESAIVNGELNMILGVKKP